MPIAKDYFDLTAQEFHDPLTVRYKKPFLSIPPHYDGSGAPFSLDHFLICKKEGLIVQRHNKLRDAIGNLAALLWGQVKCELFYLRIVLLMRLSLMTLVSVASGHHSQRRCLKYVLFTLMLSHICAMHRIQFCLRLKFRKNLSTLPLLLLVVLTLNNSVFQLMILLVLKLLVLFRDSLMVCHLVR